MKVIFILCGMLFMRECTKAYKEAVKKAIKANHALGLPVYQCRDGYIIATYPDGREVKLQKVKPSFTKVKNARC